MQAIRDILLLGHRQAFTWIDEWYGKYITHAHLPSDCLANQTKMVWQARIPQNGSATAV